MQNIIIDIKRNPHENRPSKLLQFVSSSNQHSDIYILSYRCSTIIVHMATGDVPVGHTWSEPEIEPYVVVQSIFRNTTMFSLPGKHQTLPIWKLIYLNISPHTVPFGCSIRTLYKDEYLFGLARYSSKIMVFTVFHACIIHIVQM